MYTIKVRMRKLGKKNQGAVEPVEFLLESRPETVKELVEGLVCLGVRQYNERKDTGQIVPWLTSETIQEQAVTGKISFGLRGGNDADADQAVEELLAGKLSPNAEANCDHHGHGEGHHDCKGHGEGHHGCGGHGEGHHGCGH